MKIHFKYVGPINDRGPLIISFLLTLVLTIILLGLKSTTNALNDLPIIGPLIPISSIHVPLLILISIMIFIIISSLVWFICSCISRTSRHYQIQTFILRRNLQKETNKTKNAGPNAIYKITNEDNMNKRIRKLQIYPSHKHLIVRIPLPLKYGKNIADLINNYFKSNDNYDSVNELFTNSFPQYYILFHHGKLSHNDHFIYWVFPHK